MFDPSWVFVGAAGSIPNAGDLMPIELIGRPILLARQRDGGIKAFHNVCRHRGVILVETPQAQRPTMTCPYHAWSYGPGRHTAEDPAFCG